MNIVAGDRYRDERGEIAVVERLFDSKSERCVQYNVAYRDEFGTNVETRSILQSEFLEKYSLKCNASDVQRTREKSSADAILSRYTPDWMK